MVGDSSWWLGTAATAVHDSWTVPAGSTPCLALGMPGSWRAWFLACLVPGGDDMTSIGVRACLWVGARRGRVLAAETSQVVESSFGEVDQGTLTHFGLFW